MRGAGGRGSLLVAFVALASACASSKGTAPTTTHEPPVDGGALSDDAQTTNDAGLPDVLAGASLGNLSPPHEGGAGSAPVDAEIGDASALMPVDDAGRDGGTLDAGSSDASVVEPLSCTAGGPGMTNCGSAGTGTESCCTSLHVTGGTFYRSFDGVTYTDKSDPATISDFRLDKYEITVGRFRQFVTAIVAGWRPAAGSGKHTHLNGGKGLSTTANGYETGWNSSWDGLFPTTLADWTSNLVMCQGTWTSSPGTSENKPISNQSWYDAYAFCIWNGGFLPSEAEWNYAAAGGGGPAGQRVYPWSTPSTSATIDCAHANYAHSEPGTGSPGPDCTTPSCVGGCPTTAPNNVGSESPLGDGAYGQTDMSGNIQEWMLDLYGSYVTPCVDCANLTAASGRAFHGCGWSADSTRDGNLRISYRWNQNGALDPVGCNRSGEV